MFAHSFEIPPDYHYFALAAAFLLCTMGWFLYWFGVRVAGFSLGLLLGASLGVFVPAFFGRPEFQVWAVPLLGVTLGWVCWMFFVGLFKLVVFLGTSLVVFFALGPWINPAFSPASLPEDPATLLVLFGVSAAAGALGVLFQRFLIIVLTALLGAGLMAAILPHPATFPAALAVGLFVQLGLHRRLSPRVRRLDR